jgi:hypothetical protein
MQQPAFTFDEYLPGKDGHPVSNDIMWELPRDVSATDRDAIIRNAKFRPEDKPALGVLTKGWNNHPAETVIVAGDIDFRGDHRFAVSREKVQLAG